MSDDEKSLERRITDLEQQYATGIDRLLSNMTKEVALFYGLDCFNRSMGAVADQFRERVDNLSTRLEIIEREAGLVRRICSLEDKIDHLRQASVDV